MFDNYHFFFSAKQAEVYGNQNSYTFRVRFPHPMNYALIDGKEVLYTTVSETPEHGCKWDDMKYLGQGKYSHSKGIW